VANTPRKKKRFGHLEPLADGQKFLDPSDRRTGIVTQHACQYSHPKADPVYSYLVRWEDGQVSAVSETAFTENHGLQLVD